MYGFVPFPFDVLEYCVHIFDIFDIFWYFGFDIFDIFDIRYSRFGFGVYRCCVCVRPPAFMLCIRWKELFI